MSGKVAALVTTKWLQRQLTRHVSRPVHILDTSWTALKSGEESFLDKHIPKAVFFDLNHCVKAEPTLPRNLPEVQCFEEYAQNLGINKESHLVVYDRGSMLAAARTWWTFRAYGHEDISVLDGGMNKWVVEGNDLVQGDQTSEKGDFTVNVNKSLIKNFEEMVEHVRTNSTQILDARRPEHFSGLEKEPTKFTANALKGMNQPVPTHISRGHIPGSKNLLEDLMLDPDTKCLLPPQQLLDTFWSAGVDLSKPLVTMCYNGHAGALLALAAHVCGKQDASLYYGSWTEWGQKASPDMIVGGETTGVTGA